MTGLAKLDQPHFLIRLANNELEIGVREARQALTFADDWEGHYRTAKEAYSEAVHLMATVKKTHKERQHESGNEAGASPGNACKLDL
jgi:hypothetical protein